MIFQDKIWNLFNTFFTALMSASRYGNVEIVKLLLEHKGIDVNAQTIYFLYSMFISRILFFIGIFGICSYYMKQHL